MSYDRTDFDAFASCHHRCIFADFLVGFASQKDNGTSLIDMKMTHDCMESRCMQQPSHVLQDVHWL